MLDLISRRLSARARARALAAALSLFWLPLRVHAQADQAAPAIHGTILQIDGEDIVIDLGKSRLVDTPSLSVYRAIEVRHPLTHRTLRDRFVIGSVTVIQAGESLSVVKASAPPTHSFAVGDSVEAVSRAAPAPAANRNQASTGATGALTSPPAPRPVAKVTRAQPAAAATTAATATSAASTTATTAAPAETTNVAATGVDTDPGKSDERALGAAWYTTLSRPPGERADIYAELLLLHPASRFRPFLEKEISYLRELERRMQAAHELASDADARAELALGATFTPLHSATEDEAVDLAGRVQRPETVQKLTLFARPLELEGYTAYAVSVDARGHARVRLPKTLARAPGFAYFIELTGNDGRTVTLGATAHEPSIVVVKSRRHAVPTPAGPRTSVRFSSELVSFEGTNGRDYFLLNEGDFLYRLRYGALYGVRVGYGSYNGEGGTVDALDRQHLAPEAAGFSYGFLETELELARLFGIALRGTIGLGRPRDLDSERKGLTGGFQLRARIGAADATHLVLAGELMPEIGQRAYLGLRFAPIEALPMAIEVVVTDQPVNSDELAVRLIYELGYKLTDRIALALRPSYQLRTIKHTGPGIGIAASFDW